MRDTNIFGLSWPQISMTALWLYILRYIACVCVLTADQESHFFFPSLPLIHRDRAIAFLSTLVASPALCSPPIKPALTFYLWTCVSLSMCMHLLIRSNQSRCMCAHACISSVYVCACVYAVNLSALSKAILTCCVIVLVRLKPALLYSWLFWTLCVS